MENKSKIAIKTRQDAPSRKQYSFFGIRTVNESLLKGAHLSVAQIPKYISSNLWQYFCHLLFLIFLCLVINDLIMELHPCWVTIALNPLIAFSCFINNYWYGWEEHSLMFKVSCNFFYIERGQISTCIFRCMQMYRQMRSKSTRL